jgi:ubiquinol-cytochrome c reductase cytochrome b subunit
MSVYVDLIKGIVQDVRKNGVRSFLAMQADQAITRFTAGLSWNDIRSLLRGDPPGRPNPRLKPHSEGFWLHIKPTFYHKSVTKINHTFRLGWLSTFLFFVELITGIILMTYYAPTPERAYSDMLRLLSNVPFGKLMRDIHRLAAEAMVITVTLHMFRTYFTGSYKAPRQFTWFTGVILLIVTLGLSYTGYLLPWDQLAFWAVTIGASMVEAAPPPIVGQTLNLILRGAPEIGANGLLRFYLLHVIFLPVLGIVFIAVHYYKVVHHGISLPSSEEAVGEDTARRVPAEKRVYFLPDILIDELMLAAIVIFGLVAGAAFIYGAPLESHSNPLSTPLHTVAPWYFLWIQGLLKLGDKTLMGIIVPTLVFGLLFIVPYIDFNPSRRAKDRRLAILAGLAGALALVVLTFMGTAKFGVVGAPAQEVIQEFIPEEGVGAVRAIPYDQLVPGAYDTFSLPEGMPARLGRVMEEIKRRVEGDSGLPAGHAVMVIEEWQQDLRKITMRILWTPAGASQEQQFSKTIYIHRDANYAAH